MIRVMCDRCGKELAQGETRHVLKIEAFATADVTAALTEDDLDRDHLEEVAGLLAEAEIADEGPGLDPPSASFRYDMCGPCRRRFLQNPLAREAAPKLRFSKN